MIFFLQGSPNKTRESDASTVVDSDEDSPKSDKQQNALNLPHAMNTVGGILPVLFIVEKLNNVFLKLFSCLLI